MNWARCIADVLVQQNIICVEDQEIYEFGLGQLFFQLINFTVAAIIGIFMGRFWEVLLFLIAYIPLRRYAGGWHASTQVRCFWISTLLIVIALLIIGAIPLTGLALTWLIVPGAIILFILAPVADTNKPLSRNEHKIYGRRARIILTVILAITVGLALFKRLNVVACIGTAISILSIMLVLGFIKNKGKAMLEESPEGDE